MTSSSPTNPQSHFISENLQRLLITTLLLVEHAYLYDKIIRNRILCESQWVSVHFETVGNTDVIFVVYQDLTFLLLFLMLP